MANSNCTTGTFQPRALSRAERLGYWINDNILNLRILVGAIACVMLAGISITFNYQLGLMLSSDPTSKKLLPLGYALLDVAGLFISGYISVNAKRRVSRLVGGLWFIFLLTLSLFAAWTYQCAIDHKTLNATTQAEMSRLEQAIERENKNVSYWDDQKELTSRFKSRYSDKAKESIERRDQYEKSLTGLQRASYPASLAVFYKTPFLRNDPQTSITIMRFVLASAMTLTPLILLGLMNIERSQKIVTTSSGTVHKRTVPSVPKKPEKTVPLEVVEYDSERYSKIKQGILNGDIKPSVRGLKASNFGIGTDQARQMLKDLSREGVLERAGQGYRLKQSNVFRLNAM